MDTKLLDPNYVKLPTAVVAGEKLGTAAAVVTERVKPVAKRATRGVRRFVEGVKRGWQRS